MKSLIAASSAVLSLAGTALSSPVNSRSDHIIFKGPFSIHQDSVHNIHVAYGDDFSEGEVRIVYGDCDMAEETHRHHEVGSSFIRRDARPERVSTTFHRVDMFH